MTLHFAVFLMYDHNNQFRVVVFPDSLKRHARELTSNTSYRALQRPVRFLCVNRIQDTLFSALLSLVASSQIDFAGNIPSFSMQYSASAVTVILIIHETANNCNE